MRPDRREVIFTRDTTEGLNLVAYAYGRMVVGPGDAIVATEMEHHSNMVPWQFLAQQTGATLHYLRLTDDGRLDPDSLTALDGFRTSRSSRPPTSPTRWGRSTTSPALARWAHERGAVLVVDGAQAAPHRAVDVQALGCDFYAISGHKLCGPGAGRPVGPGRAAGADGPVPDRGRDDPHGRAGADIVERPALEVRGGHARRSPSASRSARPSAISRGSAWTRSPSTSTR